LTELKFTALVGKLAPITAEYPFHILGMDILTGLPLTKRNNRSIVLFIDTTLNGWKLMLCPIKKQLQ